MAWFQNIWVHTYDSSLGDVEGELVLAGLGELAQLHAVDFGANKWSNIIGLGLALGEQVWECGIGVFAMVVVLEQFQGRVSGWCVRLGMYSKSIHIPTYLSVSLSQTGR